jgi:hypothetical protein
MLKLPILMLREVENGEFMGDLYEPAYTPGLVEKSVRADIDRVGKIDVGVRGSLKEMALKLARAFDLCETDDITALAKLNAELRQTLSRLTDVGRDDTDTIAALFRRLSAPVRYSPESGQAEPGTERCESCGNPR